MNVFYIPAVEEVQKAPDQLSRLPKLTAANHNDVVLSVKGIALSLGDLKTLEPELMIREQNIMDANHPPAFPTGYINDNIIDAFLSTCQVTPSGSKVYMVSACRGSVIGSGSKEAKERILSQLKQVAWNNYDHIFSPVNIGRHWILIHVRLGEPSYVMTGIRESI